MNHLFESLLSALPCLIRFSSQLRRSVFVSSLPRVVVVVVEIRLETRRFPWRRQEWSQMTYFLVSNKSIKSHSMLHLVQSRIWLWSMIVRKKDHFRLFFTIETSRNDESNFRSMRIARVIFLTDSLNENFHHYRMINKIFYEEHFMSNRFVSVLFFLYVYFTLSKENILQSKRKKEKKNENDRF